MIVPLPFAIVLPAVGIDPLPKNRQAFAAAEANLRVGMTMDEVRNALGKPDDVWGPTDSYLFVRDGQTAWAYGTTGRHSMPTLALLRFQDLRLAQPPVRDPRLMPPPTNVIGEKELRSSMQALYIGYPKVGPWDPVNPAHLIKAANTLIGLGKEKALAVLSEYDRVSEPLTDTWLTNLVRVAFKGNTPDAFDPPNGGIQLPQNPDQVVNPLPVVDQIPLPVQGKLPSLPSNFSDFLRQDSSKWSLRTTRLVPEDDPFVAYQHLIASADWPYPKQAASGGMSWITELSAKRATLRAIVSMVQTAYAPESSTFDSDPGHFTEADPQPEVQKMESEYKALGCHWDPVREMYVQKNGSVRPVTEFGIYPQKQYVFFAAPGYRILVNVHRSDNQSVGYEFILQADTEAPADQGLVCALDPRTGKQIYNGTLIFGDHVGGRGTRSRTGTAEIQTAALLSKGTPIQFKLTFQGKDYVSPVFKP